MHIEERTTVFRDWLSRHRGLVVKIARTYADRPQDQEDLAQDILAAIWRSLPSFRGDSKPSTWIYRVALQVALSRRRTEGRRLRTEPMATAGDPPGAGSGSVEGAARLSAVLAALRTLPAVDRAVLVMALEGESLADIAGVLGVSANAAGVKLHRARRRLLELVGE